MERRIRFKEDIDENIYKDLLIDIKEEEWLTAIKNLNKNKAEGISQITYDILQECTYQLKNIMRKYYTWLIKIELMPLAWSKAVIYPIPNWEIGT